MGNIEPFNAGWSGKIDEIRFSDLSLSAMDILTHYNNEADVATFLTFGAEETEAPSGSTVPVGALQVKGKVTVKGKLEVK